MDFRNAIVPGLLVLLAGCVGHPPTGGDAGAPVDGLEIPAQLEATLLDNIAGFWYPRSLDRANGGYMLDLGPQGEALHPGNKMIVTQARMVWFFAKLAREGYEKPGAFGEADLLAAARHGFAFLRDKMWDPEHGGFYFMVDAAGEAVTAPKKHLYGQAFGLYALSEYYLASGDEEALVLADGLFGLLEEKAHDKEYGGYVEFFNRDWSPVEDDEENYLDKGLPHAKLMNTHLHLLEALTTYYRASPSPLARERLVELIGIETDEVVREDVGACTDKYKRDWTPILEPPYNRVSYGHDVENVWLVADACEAAGIDPKKYLQLYKDLWTFSLKNGYDHDNGGFFYWGPLDGPATNRNKEWWVQAEALVSALYMHEFTGEARYREVFEQTWDFTRDNLVDWEHGGWHATFTADGPTGNKGGIWKSAYHNGRAMMECIRLLGK